MSHYTGQVQGGLQAQNSVYGNQIVGAPAEKSYLSVIETRLDTSVGHIQELGSRLCQLADRLIGSMPKPVQEGSEKSAPHSQLAQLETACSNLTALINRCQDELVRLERL